MNVNSNLASLSDMAFASSFVIYFIALVLSIVFYMRTRTLIDLKRERVDERELVAVGNESDSNSGGLSQEADFSDERISKVEASAEKFAGMTQMIVWLGVVVHAASAILRGLSASRFPFGNLYEYVLVISCFAVGIAAFFLQRREMRVLWPWVLTPILALLFFGGTKLYADSAPVVPALQSFWFPIHVSTVSIGASIGMISGVASVLYLLRLYQAQGQKGNNGSVG